MFDNIKDKMTDFKAIGIIGIGVVGYAVKTFFAEREVTVRTYDKFKETGTLLECLETNILFLCLPTLFGGAEFNKEDIYHTCSELQMLNYKGLVVVKSTVEPGTLEDLISAFPLLRLVHNPEFLSADTATKDFAEQKHIVIGGAPELTKVLADFYRRFFDDVKISECSAVESETMKLFINNFYAVKIQFFNELYLACIDNGADFSKVREMMLANSWIHPQHTRVPGNDNKLSFGGMCFPKDTNALNCYLSKRGLPRALIEATVQERKLIRRVSF